MAWVKVEARQPWTPEREDVVVVDLMPTRDICQFASELSYEDIPGSVLVRAKHLMLDAVGCGILGSTLHWSRSAVRGLRGITGVGHAPLWATSLRAAPADAALLNSSFIQGFEFDDYHERGGMHPGAIVVPTALATCCAIAPVAGKRLLEAIALGYEIGPRVGASMGCMSLLKRGWHNGSVNGVVAAALVSGRLRGLDPLQMEHAVGIAATQACGLMSAQYEAMVKRMHHGFAARAGMLGAALAELGYSGVRAVLEREYGGLASTFLSGETPDFSYLRAGRGSDWWILGVGVKPYPAMAGLHIAIEIALGWHNRDPQIARTIERIVVRVPTWLYTKGGDIPRRPFATIAAQMSFRYVLAVALIDGRVGPAQFTDDRTRAEDVWDMMSRIDVVGDASLDIVPNSFTTAVRATVTGGRELMAEGSDPPGGTKRPLTNGQIRDKFHRLVHGVVPEGRAREIEAAVLNLEQYNDISMLDDLLLC